MYELLHKVAPYPWAVDKQEQARPTRRTEDIVSVGACTGSHELIRQSRIRARNGLRILLDCSSSFGMAASNTSQGLKALPPILKPSKEFH